LREAVQLALRQNPEVQIANLNLAQSEENRVLARSALLPQAGFQTFERVQRFNLEALLGTRFPGSPQHVGPFWMFQAGPAFSAPIFDLTLWKNWRASQETVSATAAGTLTVREQMASLVISQYLGSLRAAADVTAAKSRVDLAQALYQQAADLQKAGVGTGIDTLRANVELQNETQRLMFSQTQLETSLYALARLLNVDTHRQLELTDQMSFFQTPQVQVEESLNTAYANRPELKTLRYQARALELQKQAARDARLPTFSFNGNWGYQGLSPQTSIPAYTYTFSVDLPLITSGRIGAETARAELEQKKLTQQEVDQRNVIALQVKTAAAELESARHQVEVAELGLKLAREEVAQARDRFRAGVANNVEVIQAQDALARASDNQIAALYQYNQSRANLAYATGQAESMYAK
ncbi:MAG: TolC family protein, partial [Acidobacteria bacterium]|nr:TolC family protein [Acidobacteriota bacterium]